MRSRFVKHHPLVKRNERERLMFFGAAGLAFALMLLMVFVLQSRSVASVPNTAKRTTIEPRAAIGTVTLLAPEGNVSKGTKLSTVRLREVYWPRNQVPEGAIRSAAEVKGMYSKVSLPSGMPLTRQHLTAQRADGPLMIRPGFRAVSIRVDEESGVEGHIKPGTLVDVLLTYVKDNVKATKIIVQKARVLSYGGNTEDQLDKLFSARNVRPGAGPITFETVTLEVIPEDGLKIKNAGLMGKLGLMIVPPDDDPSTAARLDVNENEVIGSTNKLARNNNNQCSRGNVRMDGREYTVNCDGTVSEILNSEEP